jgi:hypothetical protein
VGDYRFPLITITLDLERTAPHPNKTALVALLYVIVVTLVLDVVTSDFFPLVHNTVLPAPACQARKRRYGVAPMAQRRDEKDLDVRYCAASQSRPDSAACLTSYYIAQPKVEKKQSFARYTSESACALLAIPGIPLKYQTSKTRMMRPPTMPRIARTYDSHQQYGSRRADQWGFVPWNPHDGGRPRRLLTEINAIPDEYLEQRPLTLRQIYYRLIAQYGHSKDEDKGRFYDTISSVMTSARRAEMTTNDGIPLFEVIRDDELIRRTPYHFTGEGGFWSAVKRTAQRYTLDRQAGQQRRLALWCETAGMVPQLQRIADPFGIEVFSSGKFDGVMAKHDLALEWCRDGGARSILHIGDHDPSGIHIFEALARDVITFNRQIAERQGLLMPDIEFRRLAMLPGQVDRTVIPPDPRNWKDDRRFDWVATRIASTDHNEMRLTCNPDETWQAEAIAPNDLADLVSDAILQDWDDDAYEQVLDDEKRSRHVLAQRLARVERIMVRGN